MGKSISVVMTVCLSSALWLAGCGDDDDGNDDDAAGRGGTGGAIGDGGTAGTTPLPGETAGKPCSSNSDCGPGTCATQVEGLDGQPTAAPGGYCMGDCMTSADCGSGGVCVGMGMGQPGLCYDGCTGDGDCREGYLCGPITSTCRPAPPTDQLDDNTAGTACGADADCGDGICLTERGMGNNATPLPGGYCSGACLDDGHCGAGGVCRRTGAGAGRCFASCTTDAECTRDGYRCRTLGGDQLGCLPAPDPLPDGVTGSACASDADCAGVTGACATELPAVGGGALPAPGGYCTAECEIDLDCGAASECIMTRGGPRCFKACAADSECRTDYVCGERGGNMPVIVCTPFDPGDEDAGAG